MYVLLQYGWVCREGHFTCTFAQHVCRRIVGLIHNSLMVAQFPKEASKPFHLFAALRGYVLSLGRAEGDEGLRLWLPDSGNSIHCDDYPRGWASGFVAAGPVGVYVGCKRRVGRRWKVNLFLMCVHDVSNTAWPRTGAKGSDHAAALKTQRLLKKCPGSCWLPSVLENQRWSGSGGGQNSTKVLRPVVGRKCWPTTIEVWRYVERGIDWDRSASFLHILFGLRKCPQLCGAGAIRWNLRVFKVALLWN